MIIKLYCIKNVKNFIPNQRWLKMLAMSINQTKMTWGKKYTLNDNEINVV